MAIPVHHKLKGPPWALITNVEDFNISVDKRFQTSAKGIIWCKFSPWEPFSNTRVLHSILLLKSDKSNRCEQKHTPVFTEN